MKRLDTITFDARQCRRELDLLGALLTSKDELSESEDLQPLFEKSRQLTALIGLSVPTLGFADRLAYEFEVFGDFAADIIIGNLDRKSFCAIELEDARRTSVFEKTGRATSEWGRRFEHGFSQLVDWYYAFDDHKNSAGFTRHFGFGHTEFNGILLIGRSRHLSEYDRGRLRWRSNKVIVNSHKIFCLTYDDLYDSLDRLWDLRPLTSGPKKKRRS